MLDPDYIAATSLAAVMTVLLLVSAAGAWFDNARRSAAVIAASAFLPVGFWALFTYPAFDLTHHRYLPTSGVVTSVETGDDMTFIRIDGDGRLLECSDNRCGVIDVGDYIELSCLRDNDTAGADRFICEYTAIKSTGDTK